MADLVFKDAVVTIGSALSGKVRRCTVNYGARGVDNAGLQDGTESQIAGFLFWNADVDLKQDFAASQTDATIFSAVGTTVTFSVKATTAANSTTNPLYTGSALITDYTPYQTQVGELQVASVHLENAGALSRQTT